MEKTNEDNVVSNMRCDIYEKNNVFTIEMELPGYKKNDINVDCDNGYLTITAKRDNTVDQKLNKVIRQERVYGKYERQFHVGEVDSNKIIATFENGLLKLSIPKLDVKKGTKSIKIK